MVLMWPDWTSPNSSTFCETWSSGMVISALRWMITFGPFLTSRGRLYSSLPRPTDSALVSKVMEMSSTPKSYAPGSLTTYLGSMMNPCCSSAILSIEKVIGVLEMFSSLKFFVLVVPLTT